jgi:dipeptidyl aminopeptidase/acylaminoacyl peptidase
MRDHVRAFPIGDGVKTWTELTPTFNVHRIDSPVLTITFDLPAMLISWEFYSALRYRSSDHELLYFPGADHNPRLPSQRLAVMKATLSWYAKWLKLDASKVVATT